MSTGYLFAGQGSQYIGMGKDLYESFPQARAVFDKADQVLGFSLSQLCFNGPQEELIKTNNCQPAIVTTTIASWEAFKSVNNIEAVGYAAGLSLGEYSALVAVGAINFEDAVYITRRRGEFMEEEARLRPGKMLSIIGLEYAQVKQVCDEALIEIANLNCPGQIVVSGGADNILKAQSLAKSKGAKLSIILDVSGAFHSSFMNGASLKLAKELEKIKINTPRIPLISNVTACPAFSVEEIKNNLIKQVASSVLWEESMKFMLAHGVSNFIEFGPGKVLKGLMRRINPASTVTTIEKKEDIQSCLTSRQGGLGNAS